MTSTESSLDGNDAASEKQTRFTPADMEVDTSANQSELRLDSNVQEHGMDPVTTINSHISLSPGRQTAVVILVTLTQLCQMFPFGLGIDSGFSIANSLRENTQHASQIIPLSAQAQVEAAGGWIAAAYPLTSDTFVLIGGRLGEVYGHKRMLAAGCIWWVIWELVSGFAPNLVVLCVFRGLAGIGSGFIVPNAVALLGITLPPGKKRNLAFGLFGAMAPVGAAGGTAVATLLVQLTEWRWAFFSVAINGTVIFSAVLLIIPADDRADPQGKVDWIGAYLGVAGLLLFNFVWNGSRRSIRDLGVEVRQLTHSAVRHLGTIFWTDADYRILLVHVDGNLSVVHDVALHQSPRRVNSVDCGILSTTYHLRDVGGFPVRLADSKGTCSVHCGNRKRGEVMIWFTVSATWHAYAATALVISNTLVATTPIKQTYWAQLFPALLVSAFTIDLIFAASQVIASGSVSRKRQGVAASLIGTLLTYGLSTGLGFAGTVEVYTNDHGKDVLAGYRNACWLAVGLAGVGLVGSVLFLRVPKSTQEGWDEKKESE